MDATSESLIPIQELVRKTAERLEADFSQIGTKIHRFPRGLRCIGKDDRYTVPSFVALGPYHHKLLHLQEVEEVKHAAAHYFCLKARHSVEEVYGKILSIVDEARGCYADGDAAVVGFSDPEFATMMFLDGCFLLYYANMDVQPPLLGNRMVLSTGPCMLRDIYLLENQLPWLVLEALMSFTDLIMPMYMFVHKIAGKFEVGSQLPKPESFLVEFQSYRPAHLLELLRYYLVGSIPHLSRSLTTIQLCTGANELAEIGVKLTTSKKAWFADMSLQKGPLFGELSLTPLFLDDCTACWLVNMAAFEACTSVTYPSDGYTICSYLSLLAMLMDKEEDVHELRCKNLLRSFFSNQEMLDFFKGLSRHLRLGRRYFIITDEIEIYKRQRPVPIFVHKFLYNNFKTIAALLSIAGVLVGIFKTLMDLKQH